MKTKIIVAISVLLALAGCSKPQEAETKNPIPADWATSPANLANAGKSQAAEHPEQVKKRNPNARADAYMQREIEAAKQRGARQWGSK